MSRQYTETTPEGLTIRTIELPKNERDLFRLKMQMEIIRTVCPILMIMIQLFIIIKIY